MKFYNLVWKQQVSSRLLIIAILVALVFFTIVTSQTITITNLVHAETGKGEDIFKVIMTIFGVENTKGDVIALVTVNNGETSRLKFLETEAFKPVSSNLTSLVLTILLLWF
jgi:hypothetical protein